MIEFIEEWHGLYSDGVNAGYTLPGWYFWDETQAYCHGPYGTRDACVEALNIYCHENL